MLSLPSSAPQRPLLGSDNVEMDQDLMNRIVKEMERQLELKTAAQDNQQPESFARSSTNTRDFPSPSEAFKAAEHELNSSRVAAESFEKNRFLPKPRGPVLHPSFGHQNQGLESTNDFGGYNSVSNASQMYNSHAGSYYSPPSANHSKGFGRGLNTLEKEEFDRQRLRDLEKKRAYQMDLDLQLEAKKRNALNESNGASYAYDYNQLSPPPPQPQQQHVFSTSPRSSSILPGQNIDEQQRRAIQRQRQAEYRRILEEQVEEQKMKKRQEKMAAEEYDRKYGINSPPNLAVANGLALPSNIAPTCQVRTEPKPWELPESHDNLASARSHAPNSHDDVIHNRARFRFGTLDPNTQEEVLRKQEEQKRVQMALEEQIEERRKQKALEKKRQEEFEAAEEARIQRDLREMQMAQERESYTAANRSTAALSPHTKSPARPAAPRSPTFVQTTQQYHQNPSDDFEREIINAGKSPNGNEPLTENSMRLLAADLEAKNEEVQLMKEQHKTLERELEWQRNEIERLKQIQHQLASPVKQDSILNRPNVGHTNNMLEYSMPSNSKLVRVANDFHGESRQQQGPQASRFDETWLPGAGDIREPAYSEAADYVNSDDDDYDDSSILEKSLPCVSRYFVYVSKKPEVGSENPPPSTLQNIHNTIDEEEEEEEEQDSPSSVYRSPPNKHRERPSTGNFPSQQQRTPIGRPWQPSHLNKLPAYGGRADEDDEDDDDYYEEDGDAALLNDLEQSRVRTAQAARLALQRSSSQHSDHSKYSPRGSSASSASSGRFSSAVESPAKQNAENSRGNFNTEPAKEVPKKKKKTWSRKFEAFKVYRSSSTSANKQKQQQGAINALDALETAASRSNGGDVSCYSDESFLSGDEEDIAYGSDSRRILA